MGFTLAVRPLIAAMSAWVAAASEAATIEGVIITAAAVEIMADTMVSLLPAIGVLATGLLSLVIVIKGIDAILSGLADEAAHPAS